MVIISNGIPQVRKLVTLQYLFSHYVVKRFCKLSGPKDRQVSCRWRTVRIRNVEEQINQNAFRKRSILSLAMLSDNILIFRPITYQEGTYSSFKCDWQLKSKKDSLFLLIHKNTTHKYSVYRRKHFHGWWYGQLQKKKKITQHLPRWRFREAIIHVIVE